MKKDYCRNCGAVLEIKAVEDEGGNTIGSCSRCNSTNFGPVSRLEYILLSLHRFALFAWEHAKHPRKLKLSFAQADYVRTLFLGGASFEAIGRAIHSMYKRESWKYFQVFNADTFRFEFPRDKIDFMMDGLEYINAAMDRLGGYHRVIFGYAIHNGKIMRVDGVGNRCYNPDNDMVKECARRNGQEPIPDKKE